MADMVNMLIAFEQDELTPDQTVELFQKLVNTGMAWKLQGVYGRMATALLDDGLIQSPFTTE